MVTLVEWQRRIRSELLFGSLINGAEIEETDMFNSININKFKNLSLQSKNLAFLKKSLYKRRAKLFCTSCNSKDKKIGK